MFEGTAATRYWHRTEDGRVQCDVCPRACRLHEGQRGFLLPGSAVLSFGTAGCNLGCRYYLHALDFQVNDVGTPTSLGGTGGWTSDGGAR